MHDARTKSLLGVSCAVAGAIVGHLVFVWMARQGYYALILPGALVGIAAGLVMKERSVPLMVICGALALANGIFSEWRAMPFIKDDSLGYFITHLQDLRSMTLLMIALGTACGAYFVRGRMVPAKNQAIV